MEDKNIADWMNTSDPSQQKAIVDDIAGRLDLAALKISQVFLGLQPYLTNEDQPLPQIAQALRLLADVLNQLQAPLDRIDIHQLTTYFCQRLVNEDRLGSFRAGIKECAEILSALAKMKPKFPSTDARLIAQAIFSFNIERNLRDQKAATRRTLLELLDTLIQLYKPSLIINGSSKAFVEGVVLMGEFEKDPTCLGILLPMYEKLSKEWELSEDALLLIWDSFVRYYPITISGQNASVPTPDDLRRFLLNCFISNDTYAKNAFPRLIELLDTSQDLSANVKNEVFRTMETCITSYSLPAVLEWAPKVWDSVKFEVWNGENDEFIRGALNVIHGITRALSSQADWNDTENPSVKIVLSILNECKERLIDSRQRHVVETGKILYAVATASPYGFSWATRMLLPSMFTHWQGLVSKSDKTAILGIFNRILEARLLVEQELEAKLRDEASSQATPRGDGLSPPTRADYLSQSKDRLASTLNETRRNLVDDIYFSAMTEKISDSPDGTQFRVTTIQGLVFLMSIQDLLSDFEKGAIIESLNEILLQPNQIDSLSEAAASALQKISTGDPVKFQQITLVNFMSKLPKSISADKRQRKSELDSVIDLLDSLTKIACTATCNAETGQSATETDPKHYVFDVYQKALLSKLFDIIKQDGQLPYANVILGAIYRGLVSFDGVLDKELKSTHSAKPFVSSLHPYAWIPSTLLQQFVKIKHGPTNSETPYVGLDLPLDKDEVVDRFVSLLGDIITLALRSNQTTAENNFLNSRNVQSPNVSSQIWSLFVENAPENLNSTQQDLIYGPGDKCLANALSMSLVAGVRREDKSRLKIDVGNAALAMIKNATSTQNECSLYARVSMLYFLQLLVNKFGAAEEKIGGRSLVEIMVDLIHSCNSNPNELEVERYYQTLSYFTAAALACRDKSDQTLISLMVQGIKDPKAGRKVARSFRILLGPSKVMCKENFCLLRPIRQGRLFQFAVEEFIKLWRAYSFELQGDPNAKDIKTNCLIALTGCLAYMDTKVYLSHVNEVFPLILEGTNVQNDDFTKLACITIIRTLVPVCPGVIESHLDSVINRMTDRTHNTYYSPSDANVASRAAALEVLALLPRHIDKVAMLKRKNKVISELDTALADVSMEVRTQAQKCKMWYFNLVE